MKILIWHVHGGWMNAFLRGNHEYIVPRDPRHPVVYSAPSVREVEPADLADREIDVVLLQRLEEIELTERLTHRRPGRDIPAVFVEHNTPKEHPVTERHPLRDQARIPIVHVTHFNRLVWDCGDAPTAVIEHGVPDPGYLYTGGLRSLGVVINEPVRRGRVTGTDLLPLFAEHARLDCFGIASDELPRALRLPPSQMSVGGDLPVSSLHAQLAIRRAYLHPFRWTSLGLSLLEAMMLGMPVLVLATTEATRAVPPEAGCISLDPQVLVTHALHLMTDPSAAKQQGEQARTFALEHYGLERFLTAWDEFFSRTFPGRFGTRSKGAQL